MTHATQDGIKWPSRVGTSISNEPGHRDLVAHGLLLLVASLVAWFPPETRPAAAVAVPGVVLALSTWAWNRNRAAPAGQIPLAVLTLFVLVASAASGWDPARAVGEIGLLAATASMVWLASRGRPPRVFPELLAIGLAGLALWGLWQVTVGFDVLPTDLGGLSETARTYAEERLESRRAFASLPLPSHLAVLLATALPLLLARPRMSPLGFIRLGAAALCVLGLVVARSPVGVGLGLAAAAAVMIGRHRRMMSFVVVVLLLALAAVVILRPDVGRLQPLTLRWDNWRTAVWLWSTTPATGAGFASYAQATQRTPLEVGNRPAHAHNLLLEGLAELGPVGLIACLVVAVALLRLLRALWPREPALAAAVVVVPLHNLVDFSLFVSSVVLPWAVLVGWAIGRSREPAEVEKTEVPRGRATVVFAVTAALAVTALHATSVVVEEAAALSPHPTERFAGAARALELAPWRVEPQFLLAEAALMSDQPQYLDRAWSELDRRRGWRPRSAALAERRARLALARGDASLATAELWAAVEFGTPDSARARTLEELLSALEGGAGEMPR